MGQLVKLISMFSVRLSHTYRPFWVLLVLGQALDVLTFLLYHVISPNNGTAEQNPIIAFIVINFGLIGFVLVKLGYSYLVGWRLIKLDRERRFSWKVYNVLAVVAATGYVGALFNLWAIVK